MSLAQPRNLPEPTDEYDEEELIDRSQDRGIDPSTGDIPGQPSNPLNRAGSSLDVLIETQFNEDVWRTMLGDLPCLDADMACIRELQKLAVENSRELRAITERIDAVNMRIEEARARNQQSVALSTLEPLVQRMIQFSPATGIGTPDEKPSRGFFENLFGFLGSPIQGVNEVLSLIGLPLFRNQLGGDAAAQGRSIAIADLQVKVAEVENKRGEMTNLIHDRVVLVVLDFDQTRREFQVSQEIIRRELMRVRLMEVGYRYGEGTTDQYLRELSSLDTKKAQSFREWARLRRQLAQAKILILGNPDLPDY